MLRKRYNAEEQQQQQMTPTLLTPQINNGIVQVPEWHDDLTQVTQTIKCAYYNEAKLLKRSKLIRGVKQAPHINGVNYRL